MEILFLHPGGLGDIILSLPAISLVRNHFPGARITIAGNRDFIAPIAEGYAESVVSVSSIPLHRLFAHGTIPEEDRRFWRSFDRIVSWTGSGDAEFVRKMRNIHPDASIASWHPGPNEQRHVSQIFIDSLDLKLPLGTGVMPASIRLEPRVRLEGLQWLEEQAWDCQNHLIALHPGAGSKTKHWQLKRFVGLAQQLAVQLQHKLLIIEGPAEPGLGKCMQQGLPPKRSILIEAAPLSLLAAVLEQCETFIGNDSGVAHLAAGLGVPAIVLFGPTLPKHWAPLGHHVVALRDPDDCKACAGRRGDEHTCFNNISVENVMWNVIRAIRNL